MSNSSHSFDHEIVRDLKKMLDEQNVLAKSFRMARDRFNSETIVNMKLRLIRNRISDGRRYNLPTASEVAALIPGDIGPDNFERDIILETQSGLLRRISELHTAYLPLQYPLLFPKGEDGYRDDVPLNDEKGSSSRKRSKVTMR